MSKITFVVAVGDPFNGLTLYGPFKSEDQALDWAEQTGEDREFTVVRVEAPLAVQHEATA